MSALSSDKTVRGFVEKATELKMLSAEAAEELARQAARRRTAPSELALEAGMLDARQIDILQALLHPREVASGYELLNLIGYGGMGVVYRARQENLDRTVALKTVLLSQMSDAALAARFEQEAITVAKLRHPHIVAAYDFGRRGGRLYLVMEWIEGIDADQWLARRGRLDEFTAWTIVRQAAAGLAHAAHAGVVHRDVKPANLLLVTPPEGYPLRAGVPMVKITDFGLAMLTVNTDSSPRLTSKNSTLGSPHYMSPEQLDGKIVDLRADIYSLGATAFHLLAGRPPFYQYSISQIIARKVMGDPPSLDEECDDISPATCDLVARMMAAEPSGRVSDYQQLMQIIDDLLGGESMNRRLAQPPPPLDLQPATRGAVDQAKTRTLEFTGSQFGPDSGTLSGALSGADSKPRRRTSWFSRRVFVLLMSAAVVLGLSLWGAWRLLGPAPLPQDRVLTAAGPPEMLFSGTGAEGWRLLHGEWTDEPTDDGVVLAGEGLTGRVLPAPADQDHHQHYRLSMNVRLRKASMVEIHFGFQPDQDNKRRVLRITTGTVQVGTKTADFGPFQPADKKRELASPGADQDHEIHIERQLENWWIFVDNQLIGIVGRADQEARQLRLAAEGGVAWFSDIRIQQLQQSPPGGG